jgi:hypothetical protein
LPVLQNPHYGQALQKLVSSARSELALVSAFATTVGLESLLISTPESLRRKEIHVRWQVDDLLSGASDLAVYDVAKERGFAVFMQPALHAKFLLADRERLIVGSANFTGRGLGLFSQTSTEVGISTVVQGTELMLLESILAQSILVTPDLYDGIRTFIEQAKRPPHGYVTFPPDIEEILKQGYGGLWVRDLPLHFDPPSLIQGTAIDSDRELESNFTGTKCVEWLRSLMNNPAREIYFGELTSSLHDALLEDPLPYRTEVKKLAANLINWCTHLLPNEFGSDSPNYSQRLYRRF